MGKEIEKILELLVYWKEYSKEGKTDIYEFAHWLLKNDVNYTPKESEDHQYPSQQYISSTYTVDDQLTLFWARLVRYTHLWSKKALHDLPISSVEEYGLLKSVQFLRNAKKSDLISYSLLETTTCFEMIKRLIKSAYLQESVDPNDRRSRLVQLTKKGEEIIAEADQNMRQLSVLLMGDLNKPQKEELLKYLSQLNLFHEKLYHDKREATFDQLLARK